MCLPDGAGQVTERTQWVALDKQSAARGRSVGQMTQVQPSPPPVACWPDAVAQRMAA